MDFKFGIVTAFFFFQCYDLDYKYQGQDVFKSCRSFTFPLQLQEFTQTARMDARMDARMREWTRTARLDGADCEIGCENGRRLRE